MVIFDKSETIGGVLKNTCINNYRLEHGQVGFYCHEVLLELFERCSIRKTQYYCLNQSVYILTPNHCVAITEHFNLGKMVYYGLEIYSAF